MNARLNPYKVAPSLMKAMEAMEAAVKASGLEGSLIELVKIRASQINGCAYCINMHTSDARAKGETEQRIYLLDAWHESSLYTPRERSALAWTEALTLVASSRVPDSVYETAREQFSEEDLVKLTLLVTTINAWNRIAIAFRIPHAVKAAVAA